MGGVVATDEGGGGARGRAADRKAEYVEGQTRRILERRGVDLGSVEGGVEGGLVTRGIVGGGRARGEEVTALERIVVRDLGGGGGGNGSREAGQG